MEEFCADMGVRRNYYQYALMVQKYHTYERLKSRRTFFHDNFCWLAIASGRNLR